MNSALVPIHHAIAHARNPAYPLEMLVLSHSSLQSFRSCARKLEFRQFFGVPRAGEDNYAGDVGNAIHRGFQTWLMNGDATKAILAFMSKFPYDLEYLRDGNASRSFEAALGTLEQIMYSEKLRQYDVAQVRVKDGSLRYALEVPFAIEIKNAPIGIPVFYVGFMDCVLYDRLRERFIVVDVKTTRENLSDIDARYTFDGQTIPYGIVLEHALGRTVDEFAVEYFHCYIDVLEPRFSTHDFSKHREDVADWYTGLCDDIARIAAYYERENFPRAIDGRTCTAYNSKCPHFDFCGYREPGVLNRMMGGELRPGLFRDGEEPWIVAELMFNGG